MPDPNEITRTGGNVAMRQDAVGDEIAVQHDLAPAAAAAAARAREEARIAQAMKWRRDLDASRIAIIRDCRRPGYAQDAEYRKPVGKRKNPDTGKWEQVYIEGPSIRMIEGCLAHIGNLDIHADVIYDDEKKSVLRVSVTDLQNNVTYSTDAVLLKVVERREVRQGRKVLGMRENSYGDPVYLVEATPDEFRNVVGTERSKLIRDNGKRLIPYDILEEARAAVKATMADEAAKDPDAAKKKVFDRFNSIGVSVAMLKEYLDRPVETLTVADLQELAVVFNGLKDGEFTWPELMRTKEEPAEGEEAKPEPRPKLRDRILAQKPPAAETKPEAKS